jgi:hypothetical protein
VTSNEMAAPVGKRKYQSDDDDSDDEDTITGRRRAKAKHIISNEFDQYLAAPSVEDKDTLGWWRNHAQFYPQLSMMARDTFAVPATGAGVEQEFSKSGRIATPTRARLRPDTISEMMMYKNYLIRDRKPLAKMEEEIETEFEEAVSDGDEESEEVANTRSIIREVHRGRND